MFRNAVFILSFVFATSLGAQGAEVSITSQYFYKTAGKRYTVYDPQIYMQGWAGDKNGMWFFGYSEPGTNGSSDYFSLALGPYFGLSNFAEVGFGLGVETFDTGGENWKFMGRYTGQFRLGTIDTDDFYIDSYYENGPSKEPWIQSNLSIRLLDKPAIWIGAMQQSGVGTGARVKLDLGFIPLRLWIAPVMTGKYGRNAMFGGEIVFSQ